MAQQKLHGTGIEPLLIIDQEVSQVVDLVSKRNFGQWVLVDASRQFADLASLRGLPPRPGNVGDTGLQHQEEVDPLVVVVIEHSFF